MKRMTAQAKLGTVLIALALGLAIFGSAFVYAQVMRAKASDATPSPMPNATSLAPANVAD